jgi:hypothetical protein
MRKVTQGMAANYPAMPPSKNPNAKPRGVKRGDPKTPGSGRKPSGPEARTEAVQAKVSRTVKDWLARHGRTDGEAIEAAVRRLMEQEGG